MSLKEGKSEKAFNFNIKELLHKYSSSGKVGNTEPKSKEHARQIALAIAFGKKNRSEK